MGFFLGCDGVGLIGRDIFRGEINVDGHALELI